ncbi:MAG: site-specific integrase [Marinifilaceae bacterium]
MKLTIRERKRGEKIHLYMDYYNKGKRKNISLGISLIANPKTKLERSTNKKLRELAESVHAKYLLRFQNEAHNMPDFSKINTEFMVYFEQQMEKRLETDSRSNYGNWYSAFQHLKRYPKRNVRFADIDPAWLEELKYYLEHSAKGRGGRPLSKNTCVSYYRKVVATLRQAVREGIIYKNPVDMVAGIRETEPHREFLTQKELQAAQAAYCDNPVLKSAFLFGCLTGLRHSDILKLTWQEVQQYGPDKYRIRFKQKKTKSRETLPIPKDAYRLMGERRSPAEKVFLGLTYSDHNNHILQKWMIRAGIERHITFHASRHSFAVLQLESGTDIFTLKELLGHKDIKSTLVYAKIIDAKKVEAMNKLSLGN